MKDIPLVVLVLASIQKGVLQSNSFYESKASAGIFVHFKQFLLLLMYMITINLNHQNKKVILS